MKLHKNLFAGIYLLQVLFLSFLVNANSYSQTTNVESPGKQGSQGFFVDCKVSHIISAPGDTPFVRMTALVPQSIPKIQKIHSVEYSIKPSRYFTMDGNRYAEIIVNNPGRIAKIEITIHAELFKYDLLTAQRKKIKEPLERKELFEYLKAEKYIEKDDIKIREAAASIKGKSEVEIVRNIYNYVMDNMEYAILGKKDRGALYAIRHNKGDCSEYSDLFIALCRAKKIPARFITGIAVQRDTKTAAHNWAEVYFKDYGWVPFDLTRGDINSSYIRERAFTTLEPKYIYFSNLRNDRILKSYHFGLFTFYGDSIRVSDSIRFEFPKQAK